jgi:hypothetical protein
MDGGSCDLSILLAHFYQLESLFVHCRFFNAPNFAIAPFPTLKLVWLQFDTGASGGTIRCYIQRALLILTMDKIFPSLRRICLCPITYIPGVDKGSDAKLWEAWARILCRRGISLEDKDGDTILL